MYTFIKLAILFATSVSSSNIVGHKAIRQATNGPHLGTIIWICTSNINPAHNIPEVCKNMCYGAYCRGYGTALTWDKYAGRTKAERAEAAGCGRNNHCTTATPGKGSFRCNQYPFGSTSDADRKDKSAVNRCVPSDQYYRQSARLNQLFNSNGPWKNGQGLNGDPPAAFQQTFANSGELKYCSGHTSGVDCLNDGLQFDRGGRIKNSTCSDVVPREHIQYRLLSGEVIIVPDEFEIGHRVWLPREHNLTLFVEQSKTHEYDHDVGLEQFDHMVGNLWLEEDFIQERLT